MKAAVNLKPTHQMQIKAFFQTREKNDIQGGKLIALYKLIQKKGEQMTVINKQSKFTGCKALNIGEGFYIAIKHTPVKPGSFYPCKLDQMYLQQLD